VRLLFAVGIGSNNTTLDTCTNTITISADSKLAAGVQHDLQIWTLPVASDAATQSQYLGLTTPLAAPLVDGLPLSADQMEALGLDGTVPYIYQLLPAPIAPTAADASNAAALAQQVAAVLPSSLWHSPGGKPELVFVDISSDLAAEIQNLNTLITQYANSPADQARYISELAAITAQATSLGLMDATGVVQQEVFALVLQLPDLYASPGSIFLNALGSGGKVSVGGQTLSSGSSASNLSAYANSTIGVNNSAPLILALGDAAIGNAQVWWPAWRVSTRCMPRAGCT
jgi:hypothetical protein